jgi:hypothetical protein
VWAGAGGDTASGSSVGAALQASRGSIRTLVEAVLGGAAAHLVAPHPSRDSTQGDAHPVDLRWVTLAELCTIGDYPVVLDDLLLRRAGSP